MSVPYERKADLERLQLIYRRTLYLTCKIKNHQKIYMFSRMYSCSLTPTQRYYSLFVKQEL